MLKQTTSTAALIALSIGLAGCNTDDTTPHMTERAHMHGPRAHMHEVPPTAGDYEKDFLHRMSDHHQSAVAMSQLAVEKAMHPELKKMASMAIDSQTGEIAQMKGWSEEWYSHTITPHVTDDAKPMLSTLSALPPEQFDREFLSQMVKHHQMGIDMARPMVEQAPHEQTRALARKIIREQTDEIAQMKQRLSQWYGVTQAETK